MDLTRLVAAAIGALCASIVATPAATTTADAGSTDGVFVDVLTALPLDVIPDAGTPQFGPTTGVAPGVTGADDWHAAGFTGAGVKIGVIDYFDVTKYWNVAEHGPAPVAGVTARCFDAGRDCTAEFFDGVDAGDEDHGVAVVEVIKDMAPDAEIYIARALTSSDYTAVIDWFASVGVSVLNRSLGSRYDGPGDGRSSLDSIAGYAIGRGITWVNSGGNNGLDRYYRHAVRLTGDNVAFGPSGSDRFLKFRGCISLGGVRWINDWDKPASQRTDYDVFVWDSPLGDPAAGSIVASSTGNQRAGALPVEHITDALCPLGKNLTTRSLYLEIRWRGGDIANDVIEILDYGSGMGAYTQQAQSATTAIADSIESGVLAVGAIDPAAGHQLASYSSRGPTNDGRIAPDLVAPAGFSSSVRPQGFAGSSASSAVVAGGAALLLDAGLAADPNSLGDLIRHLAVDRGASGPDQLYGYGEFTLPSPPQQVSGAPSRFVALDRPKRILDTRPTSAAGPPALTGAIDPGEILDVPVLGIDGLPTTGVTAVAVNITAVANERPGVVQAIPTLRAALGGYSNLNVDAADQARANFAIVPIGENGSISLISSGGGHLVVDLLGSFVAAPGAVAGGRFVELPVAERVLDTRLAPSPGPLTSLQARRVPLPAGLDPVNVSALVVTVTGTEATAPGWIQIHPSDRPDVVGATSTVNLMPGASVANTAIVRTTSEGASVTGWFGAGTGQVVVDVIGYVTSDAAPVATGGRYVPLRPTRVLDTRLTIGELATSQQIVIDTATAGSQVPPTATGVMWNLTAVAMRRPGFARAWSADVTQPTTSALNWSTTGEVRAAAAITALDTGRACVMMSDGSPTGTAPLGHLVVDVFGYFTE